MRMRRLIFWLLVVVDFAALSVLAKAQALIDTADSSSSPVNLSVSTPNPLPDLTYIRPPETTKLRNYAFDAFGPYPIAEAGIAAGIDQVDNAPPEWKQGAEGYSKRFGSNYGIVAVTTTTRYALSEALREDTLYYRCECKGLFPRLKHAVISTFTARRGVDGHRVFSLPDLVAPYAGTMTAVYAWYPVRYDYKDAFRMGNYSLLGYVGANISLEFLYSGPHSLLTRMHLNDSHGAPDSSANPSPKNP
ncbi:MAG: hypothetical protein WCF61_03230 [Terriglobales bacterium]